LPSVYSNGPGVGTNIYTWFHCTCWKARSGGSSTLTGPLSLLLWTLLSRGLFLKVGVARALSRRMVTTARGPALIVPSVDGFGVILRFACALRHAENIISASDPRHSSPMRARARTLTDSWCTAKSVFDPPLHMHDVRVRALDDTAADFARKYVGSNIIRRFALGQILGARVPAGLTPSWPILNFTDFQVTCRDGGRGAFVAGVLGGLTSANPRG
jgi:hypothetical protein